MNFALGNTVVNLSSTVARVVGHHATTGDPILRTVSPSGRVWGGKWVADPAKTRLLTPEELQAYRNGAAVVR